MTSSIISGSVSDETGSGALVFGTSPTISNPVITNIAPAADFTFTQNAVAPFTSVNASAVANTLYLKAGSVGMGTATPAATALLDMTSTTKGVLIPRMDTTARDAIASPATGLQVYNTTTNELNYYNGSGWQALGISGSGLTTLNTLTGSSQSFANGFAGTAPAFVSATTTHTLNIPMASTASVTAGLISKADYDTFVAKLDSSSALNPANLSSAVSVAKGGTGATTLTANGILYGSGTSAVSVLAAMTDGQIIVGKNASAPQVVTMSGDVTISNLGVATVGNAGTRDATTYLAGDKNWRTFASDVIASVLPAMSANLADGTTPITHLNHTLAAGDTLAAAFNKIKFDQGDYVSKTADQTVNGTLAVNTLTGDLIVPTSPMGSTSAVNQSYVLALLNASGAKTAASTASSIANTSTSSTASINKVGLDIQSTGTWNGASADNIGLNVNVSGGTTNYAALFSGGNVGIGTTAPSRNLHVAGASGVSAKIAISGDTTGNAGAIDFIDSGSNKFWQGVRRATDHATEADRFEIHYTPDGTNFHRYLSFYPNEVADGSGGNANFSGNLTIDGNVGIGTTAPSAKLHVAGGILTDSITDNSSGNAFYINTASTAAGPGSVYINDSEAKPIMEMAPIGSRTNYSWLRIDAGTDTQRPHIGSFASATNPGLSIGPTASSSLVIDASGNVGIGTSAPSNILTVSKNASAIPTPPNNTDIYLVGVDATTTGLSMDTFGSYPNLTFRRANGTNASKSALTSSNLIGGMNFMGYGATAYTGSKARIAGYTTEAWSDTANGTALTFFTTANTTTTMYEVMRIDNNGNVGVGTTAPAEKLDVVGNIKGSGSLIVTGALDGLTNIAFTTATSNAVEATEKMMIYTFNNYATAGTAVAYTLPTAAAGKQRCYRNYTGKTGVITVNTSAAGQYIDLTGALTASGGNVTSAGALGDGACFVGVDSTHWVMFVNGGTWTAH